MIKIRKIIAALLGFLACIYMTHVVNLYTLETKTEIIAVLSVLCILSGVLIWLRGRFVPSRSRRLRLLSCGLAVLLLVLGQNVFLDQRQQVQITITAVGEDGSRVEKEAWFSAIELDGRNISLADVDVVSNDDWVFRDEYGTYACYPTEEAQENHLTISVLAKKVTMQFERNDWSGRVAVQDPSGEVTYLDLNSPSMETVRHSMDAERVYPLWLRFLLNTGAFALLSFLLEVMLQAVESLLRKTGLAVRCPQCIAKLDANLERLPTYRNTLLIGLLIAGLLSSLSLWALDYRNMNGACISILAAVCLGELMAFALERIRTRKSVQNGKHTTAIGVTTIVLFAFMLCLSVTAIAPNALNRIEEYDLTVTMMPEKNPDCLGYEAAIQLQVNGMPVSKADKSKGWSYQKNTKMFLCNTADQLISFKLKSTDRNELYVGKHMYAGMLRVEYAGKEQTIDLYSPNESQECISVSIPASRKAMLETLILLSIVFVVALFSLAIVYIGFSGTLNMVCIAYLLFVMMITAQQTVQDYGHLIQYGFSIVALLYLRMSKRNTAFEYLHHRLTCAMVVVTGFYSVFAFWGYDLFMSEGLLTVHSKSLLVFLNLCISAGAIILLLIHCFEEAAYAKVRLYPNQESVSRYRWRSFLLFSAILITICAMYYPANITSDGVDQWFQARGYYPIYNAHPAIHTLIIRLCSTIYPNPIAVTILQALLMSYVLSSVLALFYRKGVSGSRLMLLGIIVCVLPSTVSMITLISKNTLFGIFMAWLVYLCMEAFEMPDRFFSSPAKIIQTVSVLALTALIRHNAIVVVLFVGGIFLYLTLKYYKEIKFKAVAVLAAFVAMTSLISGPLYDTCEVKQSESSTHSAFVLPLSYPYFTAVCNDIALTEDEIEYVEKFISIEEIRTYFNPYNSDEMVWRDGFDTSHVTIKEALDKFVQLFKKNPQIVIGNRLQAVDLCWNVFSHQGINHVRYALGIWPPYGETGTYVQYEPDVFIPERKVAGQDHYSNGEGIAAKMNQYVTYFDNMPLLNSVLWRNGLYIILMLLSWTVALRRKQYRILSISCIPFSVLGTLFLLISWQMYQYYWFFSLSMVFILLYLYSCCAAKRD